MATPPTFTAGSVLTAAQMNAVGLWRNKSCTVTSVGGTSATASDGVVTIGTGNTSLTISNAFSADFENYRILISGVQSSADNSIRMQMGTTGTGYYGNLTYVLFSATAYTIVPLNNGNGYYVSLTDAAAPQQAASFDLFQPYLTQRTFMTGSYFSRGYSGHASGVLANFTSYTSFTLFPESGTLTGGKIRVYGYNS